MKTVTYSARRIITHILQEFPNVVASRSSHSPLPIRVEYMHLLGGALQVVSSKLICPANSIHLVSLECSFGYLEIFVVTFVTVCICTFRVLVLQLPLPHHQDISNIYHLDT